MLKPLLALLGFCAVASHAAAPLTTVGITGGVPTAFAGERSELFFRATFWVYYDGVHPVVLSSAADGSGSSYLRVGLNRITAELKDFCGAKVSATPLFLSTVPAP